MLRAFITVDLGYGDSGKGAVVDYLSKFSNADLVVKYTGGAQCKHNVVGPDGKKFPFSQFGAGTFHGIPTYLGPNFMVDPIALAREADALSKLVDFDPYNKLSVSNHSLLLTPYHKCLNRWLETKRGEDRHGSCGMGIGVCKDYWLTFGYDAPMFRDFTSPDLLSKLMLMRSRFLDIAPDCIPVRELSPLDVMSDLLASIAGRKFAGTPFSRSGRKDMETLVFEGSQGIMIDEKYGEAPYHTWSDVTPFHAMEMCKAFDITDTTIIGITRCYGTRHGNGPLPNEVDLEMHDDGNPLNEWQGGMRYGYLDMTSLKYTAKACRENGGLDYVAVTHLDEWSRIGKIKDCGEHNLHTPMYVESLIDRLSVLAPVGMCGHGPAMKNYGLTENLHQKAHSSRIVRERSKQLEEVVV